MLTAMLMSMSLYNVAERPATTGIFTPPIQIHTENAVYPRGPAEQELEGWVVVAYTIDAQGAIENVEVERSSGVPEFEESALQAARVSRFQPAVYGGEVVESTAFTQRIAFYLNDDPELSVRFRRELNKVIEAYASEDQGAFEFSYRQLDGIRRNGLIEEANYHFWGGMLGEQLGDNESAITHFRAAIENGFDRRLDEANFIVAHQRLYQLLVEQGRYEEAVQVMINLPDEIAENTELAPWVAHASNISNRLNSVEELSYSVSIESTGFYDVPLRKPTFVIDLDEGSVDSIQLRCDAKFEAYPFEEGVEIGVPTNWGGCTLRILGYPGSVVTVSQW